MNSSESPHGDSLPESDIPLPFEAVSSVPTADVPMEPAAAPPPPAETGGRRSTAAGWALLLALASLGLAAFSVWQGNEWRVQNVNLREELAKRLSESDSTAADLRSRMRLENESLTTVQGKLGVLEAQVGKSEGQAAALEALYQQFARSQEDRLVAEVQQAVAIASQQLQYAGNIETALIALRSAQSRLEQNDHGQFAALRRALAADIERLSQQGALDIPGTALRLERLLERVDALPLAYSSEVSVVAPPAAPGEEGEGVAHFMRGLARDLWAELRSLVKFERLDTEAEPVLLAPEQSAFLRENLKIRLLTARLAMLARDGHTYATDLAQARNWIERFFDMRNTDAQEVVEELRKLEAMPVGVKRYELTDSANAVLLFQTRAQARGDAPKQGDAAGQADPAQPVQP